MEDYLGKINGVSSKAKSLVLRQNKISGRHYALDKTGLETHTNSELTALAVRKLVSPDELAGVELLCSGTSTPDFLLPSHAVMVHGHLNEMKAVEVVSNSGVCCAGMHSLKYAFNAIRSGDKNVAIVTGSERISGGLRNWQYESEIAGLNGSSRDHKLAFDKDFLRWMLSDGAGAFLLDSQPAKTGISLRIDWVEGVSYANSEEVCMYMGGNKSTNGNLKSHFDLRPQEIISESAMSVKQDMRLLGEKIIELGVHQLKRSLVKWKQDIDSITYFLPHISSYYFWNKLADELAAVKVDIPLNKWFTNLDRVGNVGSASIFLMMDELFQSGKLKKGDQIIICVPESSRFSYVTGKFTVC